MERKQKIIFGIFILIFVILVIIFILILSSNKKKNLSQAEYIVQPSSTEIVSQPIVQEQSDLNEIINTARGFVEIYFTYSNSSDFSNARELYSFMTDNFRANVDRLISSSSGLSSEYYLKNTIVTNTGIQGKYDPGSISTVVNVSAIEKDIDTNNKETINEKKYNVYMIKTDKWRVDDIKVKNNNTEKSIFD